MKIGVVLSVIASMVAHLKGESLEVYACPDNNNHVLVFNFTDQMREDQVICQFTDDVRLKDCSGQPFMKVENNSVLLTRDLRTVCVYEEVEFGNNSSYLVNNTNSFIVCTFTCENATNTDIDIIGNIERLEPYTFKFYQNTYKTEVRELTPMNTRLSIHPSIDVLIEECAANATSIDMFFDLIQDGDGAFVWKVETSNNGLFLAEEIDYERNTFYTLEVVYKSRELNGNATAKIHVSVIDVDDEDPIFEAPVYTLRPREEDNATLDTWLETTPKIFAYDQDFGINASVVYTIRNQSDPGLFRIDNTTGLMSVSRVLDREQTASYVVVIMASQTDDSQRTATASVLVYVMDTDDNPPTFYQRNYNVSVTDHAIAGTVVAMVTAVDIDEGINANFTYELSGKPPPVSIDPYTGVIRVTHSNKLDKKLYKDGTFSFQVGTKPANPNGLSGNTATVNVNIIEADRNDGILVQTDGNGDFGGSEIGLVVLSTIVLIGGIIIGCLVRKVVQVNRQVNRQYKVSSFRMDRSSREKHPVGESRDQTEMSTVEQRIHIYDDHIKDIQGFVSNQKSRNKHNTPNNARVETVLGFQKSEILKQPNGRGNDDTKEPVKNDRSKIQNVCQDEMKTDIRNMEIEETSSYGCESEYNASSEPESDSQDKDSLSSQENQSDDTESIIEEPAIDYTIKSVRISNEVLDLEKNTILPLNSPISTEETYRGLNEAHNGVQGIKQKYQPKTRQGDEARVQQHIGGLVLGDMLPGTKPGTYDIIRHNKDINNAKLAIQVTDNDKGHDGVTYKTQTMATNNSPEADTFKGKQITRNLVENTYTELPKGEEFDYKIRRYKRQHNLNLEFGQGKNDRDHGQRMQEGVEETERHASRVSGLEENCDAKQENRIREGGEETERYTSHGSGQEKDIVAKQDNGIQEGGGETESYTSRDSSLEEDIDANHDYGLQECGREIKRYACHDSDLDLEEVNNGNPCYAVIRYLSSEDEITFPVDNIDESVSDTSEENSPWQYHSRVIQGSVVSDV